jgi:hypothetical protein
MADAPYLVCLALVQRDGRRALPLAGKSRPPAAAGDPARGGEEGQGPGEEGPGEEGRSLALELLLRLWQGSDTDALQRAAGEDSLLVLEMPLERLSEDLPVLKAGWLGSGDTAALLAGLRRLATRGWRIGVAKYEPIRFTAWC